MHLRHAAVLALVGWYLTMPPVVQIILGRRVERGSSFGRETLLPQNRDQDRRVGPVLPGTFSGIHEMLVSRCRCSSTAESTICNRWDLAGCGKTIISHSIIM